MSKVKHNSKNYNKNGNSRSNRKPRGDKFDAKTATNNPAWYSTDPALLRDSASIPFSWALGTPISLENEALAQFSENQEFNIPGVCALYCVPSIGRAETSADPINTAAFRVYSFVRHLNSGSANYDAPDLMLYLLSMGQVYSYLNFLQRAYGICTTYAQKNRYLPDVLLLKMGIDPSNIRNNLASFRYGINALINKIASMNVPATMTIFARHASLYQNLYIEGPSIKEQMYFYTPQGFWKFTLDPTGAGMLQYSQFVGENPKGVDELLEYGNDMIARLIQSEDMNIMSGDIHKAYGDGALIKLSPLPEVYPIVPLADLAVLQQIKNATVMPISAKDGDRDVRQSASRGHLMFTPYLDSYDQTTYTDSADLKAIAQIWKTYAEKRLITVSSPEPTPEEIMESTRCMSIAKVCKEDSSDSYTVLNVYPGTEIVTAVRYSFQTSDRGWIEDDTAGPNYVVPIKLDWNVSTEASLWIQSVLANFKFHPAHHFVGWKYEGDDLNLSQSFLNFDVDNYAVIDASILQRMHESALLSMLNVPSIVKV